MVLADGTLPLLAGSVHYWRMEPETWLPALEALHGLGLGLVDTYVPWGAHERAAGEHDFGAADPKLDIVRFLEVAAKLGLYAIVRPGPHINAELTHFGIPERVIWDPECQARSAGNQPVVLPVPPLAFPVPSYASRAFLREASRWLQAVGERLGPLCYPQGPIVLCQVDNEGAMYFRDGVYDQDYHPDAVQNYHKFLKRKYDSPAELGRVIGQEVSGFDIDPPRRLEAERSRDLSRHLDWAEAQEELLARSFRKMRDVLSEAGMKVPFSHNLPIGETMTPLDPGRLNDVVELVGLDYYHVATPGQRSVIARRTTELSVRAAAHDVPAFACELGAGFPPFFPPLTETDNTFTAMTALAYGLRGFNLYMAVDRDRWIGAPYDRKGRARPSQERWRKLADALNAVRFHELTRQAAVHLVVPRSLRRLQRVQHAFGPLSAVVFQVMGQGAADGGLEDAFDLGAPFALDTEHFLRWFEQKLDALRIPFAFVGGDLVDYSLAQAKWTIIACAGGLERAILESAMRGLKAGRCVSIGPHLPQRDEALVPREPPGALRPSFMPDFPVLLEQEPARLEVAFERALRYLDLPRLDATPSELHVTVHQDASAVPRVLCVINPTSDPVRGRVGAVGASAADDLLDGSTFHASVAGFELEVAARSVRMLALRF